MIDIFVHREAVKDSCFITSHANTKLSPAIHKSILVSLIYIIFCTPCFAKRGAAPKVDPVVFEGKEFKIKNDCCEHPPGSGVRRSGYLTIKNTDTDEVLKELYLFETEDYPDQIESDVLDFYVQKIELDEVARSLTFTTETILEIIPKNEDENEDDDDDEVIKCNRAVAHINLDTLEITYDDDKYKPNGF